MKILLVNDDGFNAPGILKAEEILNKYGEVFVVAPSVPQSGKSSSINIFFGTTYHKVDEHHYMVDGSPVDCVEFGQCLLNTKFDLVVSGCNRGYNVSQDIMYSGTCGACFQATIDNIPAIAISQPFKDDFSNLDVMLPLVIDYINKYNLLSTNYYLNVNFPDAITDQIKIATLKENIKEELFIEMQQDNFVKINRKFDYSTYDSNNDNILVKNGFITISPIATNCFKEKFYNEILEKVSCKK